MASILFSRKALLLLPLLVAALLGTGLATLQARQGIEEEEARALSFQADQLTMLIYERLISHELILRGAQSFVRGSADVSRSEWRDYAAKLDADSIVPGLQGLGFAQLIAPAELARHEASVRAEGFPDYRVWPQGERELYTSIVYLEPFRDRNLLAFGYDMYSEPVRRAAMERARDLGRAALSGKVALVQETGENVQPGTLLYLPVYDPALPISTIEERRAALRGWVYSPFRMHDLMGGLMTGRDTAAGRYVDLSIFDGESPTADSLLFGQVLDTHKHQRALFEERAIQFGGTQWLLHFHRRSDAPGLDYASAWLILASGTAISILLYGLLLSLIGTRERARRIADTLTHDLRAREALLQESEFRWHFAIEGSGDGLWDWNIPESRVFFSSRWKSMLGFADFEIGDGLDEWEKRVHPDDLEATLATIRDHLEGRSAAYASEHRVLCKDGSYRWILDRGAIVARDAIGQPTRMIGTHSDIHARKLLEEDLRRSKADLQEAQRIARMGSWKLYFPSGRIEYSELIHRMFALGPDQPTPSFAELESLYMPESWDRLRAAVETAREHGTPYELELEIARVDGRRGWMQARGEVLRDAVGTIVGLHGSATDITERVQARRRIEQLGKLYAALSACNLAIVHCRDEAQLFDRVCEVVVRHGGMTMAWIGLLRESDGRILPAHRAGDGLEYLEGIEISVRADDAHGRGPTGTATRENRAVWVEDFPRDQRTGPWHSRGQRFGWAASAAIPIRRGGHPVGALTIYSAESGWLDAETKSLLEEIGDNVSYALDKMSLEAAAARYQAGLEEAEQRFRSLVEQSIAGSFIVQGEVLVYANPRMADILGLADPALMQGQSPLDWVAPADRERIRAQIDRARQGEVMEGRQLFTATRADGSPVEVGITLSLSSYRGQTAVIGMMQDISDRQLAEEQIRRYAKQLEHTFMQTVGLANTLSEMRDPYTAGHERRVAEIAVAIAREMGLDEDRLEGLRVGGYLHDVGKMVVPAEILSKPARLNPLEYELVKAHPQAGYDILKEVDFPWPVADIAYQHHERYDGGGYPRGLKGEEIVLEARIVAVADVVESMASHRPYRPGLGIDKALAEIESGIGTRYDPVPAQACLRLFREKGYQLPD